MTILAEIEAFLADTDMTPTRFGRQSVNNAVLVRRLRNGCEVTPGTAERIRAFIAAERANPTPYGRPVAKAHNCGCGAPITHKAKRCRSCASKEMARVMLRPVPGDFREVAPGRSINELQRIYGAGPDTIVRWRKETGVGTSRIPAPRRVAPRKPTGIRSRQPLPRPLIDARDQSRAGLAAQFLQKFGPVFRCTAEGQADPKGTHWRRSSSVLTDAEIMERATRQGWRPNQWRELAA